MKALFLIPIAFAASAAFAQPQTLEQALAQARSSRASLQAARLRLEQARTTRKALGTYPGTTLFLGYSNDERVGGNDDDLVLAQPLDVFGRTRAIRGTGDALVREAEATLRQTELDLQNDVVSLYVDVVAAGARLETARESESGAKKLLEAIRALVEGGKLPGVQATRVAVELQRAEAVRKQRASDLAATTRRFNSALAQSESRPLSGFPTMPVQSVNDAQLTLHRADLLLLSAEVASAQAEAGIARTSRLPQLELQGRRSSWHESSPVFGARLQLSFPLFDFGKSRAEETAALKRAQAASRALDDALRIAKGEVEAASIEVQGARQQVADLESVVSIARELVSRTRTGLTEGANTLIDVLDAARALREIEESLIGARASQAQAEARYLRATGTILEGSK